MPHVDLAPDITEDPETLSLMDILETISQEKDCDILVLSGPIERDQARALFDIIERTEGQLRTNVIVFLCTFGGDAHSAYTIAKAINRVYEHFTLFVTGPCKSAGTLLALGADSIVMSERAELGPLDVQHIREDTLGLMTSGLDYKNAIIALSESAFTAFETTFLETIRRSGGLITTQTASSIAAKIAGDLIAPIAGQLDPLKLGEIQRTMYIAVEYGLRLGADLEVVHSLATHYPSHAFVIDFEEAQTLFSDVRLPSPEERLLEATVRTVLIEETEVECIREPLQKSLVVLLRSQEDPKSDVDTDVPSGVTESEETKDVSVEDLSRKGETSAETSESTEVVEEISHDSSTISKTATESTEGTRNHSNGEGREGD